MKYINYLLRLGVESTAKCCSSMVGSRDVKRSVGRSTWFVKKYILQTSYASRFYSRGQVWIGINSYITLYGLCVVK